MKTVKVYAADIIMRELDIELAILQDSLCAGRLTEEAYQAKVEARCTNAARRIDAANIQLSNFASVQA